MRVRHVAPLSAIVLVAFLGCSSDSGSSQESSSVSGQASAAYDDAKAKAGDVMEEAQAEFDSYRDRTMGQIEQYESQLGSLKTTAKQINNEELNGMVDQIDTKLEEAKDTVTGMTADNMDAARKMVDARMGEVKDLFGEAQKKMSSLDIDTSKIPGMGK